jgi:hypothetical protein
MLVTSATAPLRQPVPTTHLLFVFFVQLLNELYHSDKGYSRPDTVVLCDKHPSTEIKHVLYTHSAAKSVTYIHGSPFRV